VIRLVRRALLVVGRAAAPPPARHGGSARGFVIVEMALAIPMLLSVTVALAWGLSLGSVSMSLGDAARQAARDLARGVPTGQAVARAQALIPEATLRVIESGAVVVVAAEQEVAAPGPVLGGLSVTVHQQVSVPREWT